MTLPRRVPLLLALLVLGAAPACKQPGRLDLLLRPSDDLDLAAVPELEVRLLNDTNGGELGRATVAGEGLAELPTAFAKSAIDPGTDYVFEIRAAVDAAVCPSGRVVGRSMPVSVGSDTGSATATAFVSCADGFTATGRLRTERAAHAAIWAPEQGGALMIGGASELRYSLDPPAVTATPLAAVERYDVATGQFSNLPDLTDARVLPGVGLDAQGRVVVMAGAGDNLGQPDQWLDLAEEIDGDARRGKGNVDGRWFGPTVLGLADGTFALIGTGLHVGPPAAAYQASFYDPATERIPRDAVERLGVPANEIVVPFPGRGRALLVGGDWGEDSDDLARPSLLCADFDCGCGAPPCLLDLGDEADPSSFGPGQRWNEGQGAYLSCPEGGGTAYVVGGQVRNDGDHARRHSVGDVYCYRDTDPPSTELVRVGEVTPRNAHGVVAVRGDRLLVVGGTATEDGGDRTGQGVPEAEIIQVSACACDPIDASDVTEVLVDPLLEEPTIFLYGRSALVLGDGTVLVTGTSEVQAGLTSLGARSDAWVFNPDLPE